MDARCVDDYSYFMFAPRSIVWWCAGALHCTSDVVVISMQALHLQHVICIAANELPPLLISIQLLVHC